MRSFLLVLIAACLLVGCKKDNSISARYSGRWELRKTYGGFGPADSTYVPGNGNIYQLNSNSTYKHFTGGDQDSQGSFKIKTANNPGGNSTDIIYFDNAADGTPISLANSKLTLGTSIADGLTSEYEKIGN